MRLPDTLSAEERSKRWWLDWRSVDFSWMSLDHKHHATDVEREEGQSLQDYWRIDPATGTTRSDEILIAAGELETDPCGNLWHLVHVPLHWDNGSPTWKAERADAKWQLFWKLIRERLKVANVHAFGEKPSEEEPNEAELSGVVFGEVPDDWLWHNVEDCLNARFLTCAFLGRVSFYGVESISDLDLRHCLFSSTANFDAVKVKHDLRIDSAAFRSHLKMARASIDGNLNPSLSPPTKPFFRVNKLITTNTIRWHYKFQFLSGMIVLLTPPGL